MSSKSIIGFAVGDKVTVYSGHKNYPGRVLATDLKGGRPLAVVYSLLNCDYLKKFKEDGTTCIPDVFIKKAPVVRYEYQRIPVNIHDRTHVRFPIPLGKPKTPSDYHGILKFTFEDEELTSVQLIKE